SVQAEGRLLGGGLRERRPAGGGGDRYQGHRESDAGTHRSMQEGAAGLVLDASERRMEEGRSRGRSRDEKDREETLTCDNGDSLQYWQGHDASHGLRPIYQFGPPGDARWWVLRSLIRL